MYNNPYTDFLAVKDSEMFFGRKELLIELYVACRQGRCVSLKGTRRVGKSSLIKHMLSLELQQKLGVEQELARQVLVSVSMRDHLRSTAEEFFQDVYKKIVKSAPYDCAQPEESGKEWSELFKSCLGVLHEANYHVVLFMDAFDKVMEESHLGQHFFSYLRAHAERGWISYITTSIHPLDKILINGVTSPLFNIFQVKIVGALDMEEAVQLITIPSALVDLPCSPEEVRWVIEKAGRHPFFLQRVCQYLLEEKSNAQNGQVLNFEQLEQKVYKELSPHFDSIWKDLSQEEQSKLKREIQHINRADQSHYIATTLEELSESALFRYHIHTTFQLEQLELSLDELKTILEHYQEREFLAKSVLASMHYVEIKRKENDASPYQIGNLVQEFLGKAFERMKPAGARSEGSATWRSYNIIDYRFIRRQLAQDHIMARLAIARRQYFRSQNDALNEFRRHLLEVNSESFNL